VTEFFIALIRTLPCIAVPCCGGVSGEAEDPAAVPVYWISKWVDYSDKYGLGYQLSDNSVGVLFNDNTRLILTTQGE